jgi:hypothetical protein
MVLRFLYIFILLMFHNILRAAELTLNLNCRFWFSSTLFLWLELNSFVVENIGLSLVWFYFFLSLQEVFVFKISWIESLISFFYKFGFLLNNFFPLSRFEIHSLILHPVFPFELFIYFSFYFTLPIFIKFLKSCLIFLQFIKILINLLLNRFIFLLILTFEKPDGFLVSNAQKLIRL